MTEEIQVSAGTGETPETVTEAVAEFAELDVDAPLVGIVMGSKSDMAAM
jgi:hypothetical protein